MESGAGDPAGYELAFTEGRRRLDGQVSALKEWRDRMATVVSAAGVVAGLSAALLPDDGEHLDCGGRVAIVFVGVGFLARIHRSA